MPLQRLARSRHPAHTRSPVQHVYFTWPDRRFRYQCHGCGACCKGHGIGLDVAGGQLVQLLARRPALAAFLRRRGDAITAFNPRDRCWFLADDGLCRIEVEDGRAAKPASCRLFPFNRIFRLGDITIVDYNSVICPLHIADDDGVSHAEIAAEIATITDPAVIATPLPARDPTAEARAFVDTERPIAAALFAAPGDLAAAWSA
ncbi:MAG: YkgJ family cysteine cluster protein, partial [Deltaproteobacteria bacterium]